MKILLKEHCSVKIYKEKQDLDKDEYSLSLDSFALLEKHQPRKIFNNTSPFLFEKKENCYHLQANYYIGADWLIEGEKFVQVEPKINKKIIENFQNQIESDDENQRKIELTSNENDTIEISFIKMLFEVYSSEIAPHTQDLVQIFWCEKSIPIEQKQDMLTPFLVVQFLGLLKTIVRKGLKKSYYTKQENLKNRVKGKILVAQHLKQNIFKNRMTQTTCEYQVFGENSLENRFLKKVFQFCVHYIENFEAFSDKNEVQQIINYCRPAFELISSDIPQNELKNIKHNPFFKEYREAIKIGNFILKRFAYNISETTKEKVEIPPFWIDMPKLFELYVYKKLKENNELQGKIHYQFKTHGNQLDFLIVDGENSLIIDTKYKMKYDYGHIHEDIRQVSGYARLRKVRQKIGLTEDKHISCLIVYPSFEEQAATQISLKELPEIAHYYKVYKLGIKLPTVEKNNKESFFMVHLPH